MQVQRKSRLIVAGLLASVALAGCAPRELPGFGHRPPVLRDVKVGLIALLAFGAIAVPLGYAVGFLKRAPSLTRFERFKPTWTVA